MPPPPVPLRVLQRGAVGPPAGLAAPAAAMQGRPAALTALLHTPATPPATPSRSTAATATAPEDDDDDLYGMGIPARRGTLSSAAPEDDEDGIYGVPVENSARDTPSTTAVAGSNATAVEPGNNTSVHPALAVEQPVPNIAAAAHRRRARCRQRPRPLACWSAAQRSSWLGRRISLRRQLHRASAVQHHLSELQSLTSKRLPLPPAVRCQHGWLVRVSAPSTDAES